MGPENPGQAETPHPDGVFVDEDLQAGDSGHQGRILRPPGDSGHPPVILSGGVSSTAPHNLAKGRKNQGPETPAWQAGNSGQELSCSNRTLPFLPFLMGDA